MNENAIKKTIPSEKEAEELLEEAEKLNPGSWTAHCKTAGICARKIAERCRGLDEDKAYVMGLLHDIGRREGIMDMKHIICGYHFMKSKGYVDISRICLTHFFPYKDIRAYNGKNDCTEKETQFIEKYLEETEYDDYDRLIQLCDALSFPDGPTFLEKRLVDVVMRRGFNDLTVDKWKAFFKLKEYFDEKAGQDIYKVINLK